MNASPSRTAQPTDPLDGLAACCVSLVEEAVARRGVMHAVGPAQRRLAAMDGVARERLNRALRDLPAFKSDALDLAPGVVVEAVTGAMAQVLGAIGAGRIDAVQGRAALEPILRIAGANSAGILSASGGRATRSGSGAAVSPTQGAPAGAH